MFQQMQAMAQKQVIFYILTECVFFFSLNTYLFVQFFFCSFLFKLDCLSFILCRYDFIFIRHNFLFLFLN